MTKSNDDEGRETMQKRQRRHEDITMKGNIDLQQEAKLLKK